MYVGNYFHDDNLYTLLSVRSDVVQIVCAEPILKPRWFWGDGKGRLIETFHAGIGPDPRGELVGNGFERLLSISQFSTSPSQEIRVIRTKVQNVSSPSRWFPGNLHPGIVTGRSLYLSLT